MKALRALSVIIGDICGSKHPTASDQRIVTKHRRSPLSTTEGPRPAGNDGLPFLGETLSFAKNPFGFILERLGRHGRIFRSNVLGRKTAVIAGPEAAGKFI